MPTHPSLGRRGTGLVYKEDTGMGRWALIAIIGFALGLWGFFWFYILPADQAHVDAKRVFMGQCVVVKGETEKRCTELWRWRLERGDK
jgi:hypothetical protein